MEKNKFLRSAGFLLLTLLVLWLISRNISLIPSWNMGLFIISGIICLVLLFLLIRSVYRSYTPPLQTKHWLGFILFSLLSIAVSFFGFVWARLDNKNTGLFGHYAGRFHFPKMTFYLYQTGILGTSTYVNYSHPGEIISHRIPQISFWNEPQPIQIEERGDDYLIYGTKHQYLFKTKSRVAEEIK